MGSLLVYDKIYSCEKSALFCLKRLGNDNFVTWTFNFAPYFQDVLDSKNSAIKDLQYELARVCKVWHYKFYIAAHM